MDYSIKLRFSIIKNLNSIVNKDFTESNIKELLIDIREFIPQFEILREVADFVAHPFRDRGLCVSAIDIFYAKLKLRLPQDNPLDFNGEKIPKKLFETLLVQGVHNINDQELIKETGLTKQILQKIINKNYKTREHFAYLDNRYKLEEMVRGVNYIFKHLEVNEVFSQDELIKQFKASINIVQEYFTLQGSFVNAIEENANDILVCIMALLHDARITLFDKTVGKMEMTIVPEKEKMKQLQYDELHIGLTASVTIENKSHIKLQFCVIKSDAKAINYIEGFGIETYQNTLKEIITSRVGKKLLLTPSEIA